MTFIEYKFPDRDVYGHWSTQVDINLPQPPVGLHTFTRFFSTNVHNCFLSAQESHLGGRDERSIGIPWETPLLAMSITCGLQWPRQRCQVSISGALVYRAIGAAGVLLCCTRGVFVVRT